MTETHRFSLNSPLFSPVKNGPKQTVRFFRANIKTAQNLLNIAPRGSKQGVFAAITHTEKNAVKNKNLVM